MELYQILINLVKHPSAPRFYRELRDYYLKSGMFNEAAAFDRLLEHKFGEKNDPINDSFASEKQRENNRTDVEFDTTIER